MPTDLPKISERASHLASYQALLLALIILLGGLWLYSRHNDFPYYYHPDEPVKVKQLIQSEWNFHHPLLLLESVELARTLSGAGSDPQRIVEVGRWISALFAVIGVLAFAGIGWWKGGPWGAVAVTAFLLPHHQVFELAHYLKEDTALFMGVGLTFLALIHSSRTGTRLSILLLGAAAGIALSAKYLGGLLILVALIWLIGIPRAKLKLPRSQAILLFFISLTVVVLTINQRALWNIDRVQTSFAREIHLATGGQGGVTRSVPHGQYTAIFLDNSQPLIWFGLLACLWFAWKQRKSRPLDEWLMLGFGLGYLLLLTFSPKSNDRYFLAVTPLICLGAALGICKLFTTLGWQRYFSLGIALAFASSLPSLQTYYTAFQKDDRRELAAWITTHLPASAKILQERSAGLPGTGVNNSPKILPQKFRTKRMAADFATFDEYLRDGFTHLLVSPSVYGKFFMENLVASENKDVQHAARTAFYTRLFKEGKLLWESPRSTVIYLHPGLKLYELPASPDAEP